MIEPSRLALLAEVVAGRLATGRGRSKGQRSRDVMVEMLTSSQGVSPARIG
jgi:hypothetical protein